jgi:hypothetical protein
MSASDGLRPWLFGLVPHETGGGGRGPYGRGIEDDIVKLDERVRFWILCALKCPTLVKTCFWTS